ncbi:hypothetical protein [Streptococcus australis]|uniref:hypothetical protein n=1 Tax=Streptococcus australis TaxID=113107 RepID=UPI0032EF9095
MKKKLMIVAIASIIALSVWSLVHNDLNFEVTFNDSQTNLIEHSYEHEAYGIVFDLLENKLY